MLNVVSGFYFYYTKVWKKAMEFYSDNNWIDMVSINEQLIVIIIIISNN